MLEIKNLTKIYKTSRKTSCVAINNISLTFPSTGMIFIIGKSGSGKSTLLNMIGTLDNITSGDIIVDGKSFSLFNNRKMQEYRCSYLGFIFQDFLLLEEFTVKENIELALDIASVKDDEITEKIIKKVGLTGKEDKFPSELSGGQRQRVAIARALIKNPKLLLCDEPTGNLDYKTSKQILDILKEQSKEKLVIVVSHNLEDAEHYADRIIELSDGSVKQDVTKDPNHINSLIIEEDQVILPHHKNLTSKEVEQLNTLLKEKKFKVIQNKGSFFKTKEVTSDIKDFTLTSSHLTHKNSVKLSSIFFRKNKHGVPYTILITTLFISLFYIFQIFVSFNGNNSLKYDIHDNTISVININEQTTQGTLSSSYVLPIDDEVINEYIEKGYEGNIYKLINYGVSISTGRLEGGYYTRFPALFEYNNITETLGTLCCDKEYLINLYGVDGELNVLAGNLEEADKKLIITDYIADILINRKNAKYVDYEGCLKANKNYAAIISTGYKERHQEVLACGIKAMNDGISTHDYFEQNSKNELHLKFLEEVHDYLAISYLFTDDFYASMYNETNTSKVNLSRMDITDDIGKSFYTENNHAAVLNETLSDNDIILSYTLYSYIYEKNYNQNNTHDFKPHKIVITKYEDPDRKERIIYQKEYNVIALGDQTQVSLNNYRELLQLSKFTYGLYFDNMEDRDLIYQVSEEEGLFIRTLDTGVVPVINTILELFRGFCYLIICLLFVVIIGQIVFYGINCIKKNIYEIGVLKALGAKSFDIGRIFVTQIAILGIAVIITSILGIIVSSIFSNMLLVSAFEDFMTITIFKLKIITSSPKIISLDLSLVFVLSIVSSIIPLIYLRTIKPLNILKGKKK